MTAPWVAPKPDAVSALLTCAESLRVTARSIEAIELVPQSLPEFRELLASMRKAAFIAVSLGARELGAPRPATPSHPGEYRIAATGPESVGVAIGRVKREA